MLDNLEQYIDDFHGFVKAIWNAPKLVVARVDGGAVGFGSDVALACDLRVLSQRGYFQEAFAKIGLIPDGGGTGTLMRFVGLGIASELVHLATKVESDRALQLGLATRVVPHEELLPTALELAHRIAANSGHALRMCKRLLKEAQHARLDTIMEMSAGFQALAHHTAEHEAALDGFLSRIKG
jgi:enoyl-CoA hydratase/carnithine racemase